MDIRTLQRGLLMAVLGVWGSSLTARGADPVKAPADAGVESRSWVVERPLFEELLSDQTPGHRAEGSLIWQHLLDLPVGRATAVRWATRYVAEEMYRTHAESGFKLVCSTPNRTDAPQLARKYRVLSVPEGAAPAIGPDGNPLYILHPASLRRYYAGIEALFEHPDADLVWGVLGGDERDDVAVYRAADLIRDPGTHRYIHDIDRQVRERFGGNRWGLPRGTKALDPNPYKWIALYRYVAHEMRACQAELYRLVKRKRPHWVVFSFDSPGGIYPTEWSALAPYADIFTQQMGYPGGSHRWRATAGFLSKVVSDLTGKEFWPCIHLEHHDYPDSTPSEVLEEISQIFRNGGTGIHLFLADIRNARTLRLDRRTTYFGSPRRYQTLVNIARFIRSMPPPKLPSYDRTAILYNDDTIASRPHDGPDHYGAATQACYTLLGPVAKSWFRFVDSRQLLEWTSLKERFDILYVPAAKYQRRAITERLRSFVAAGGTLICGDPEAFQTDLLGNDTSGLRKEIFGVTVGAAQAGHRTLSRVDADADRLAVRGPAFSLTPQRGVRTLARFDDGSPAITVNPKGAGRAVLFAANPFTPEAVGDPRWRGFFEEFVDQMGTPVGFDIWRFKLPGRLLWRAPPAPGVCWTNNSVVWREEVPGFDHNRAVRGTYRFVETPPARMPDVEPAGPIPFTRGRLTDRRDGIQAAKRSARAYADYELPDSHWMISWSKLDRVTIEFDLQAPHALGEVRLWFRDTLPRVRVLGSRAGRQWEPLGETAGLLAGPHDVHDVHIRLTGERPVRYVRVVCARRQPAQILSLIEAELWGAPAAAPPAADR